MTVTIGGEEQEIESKEQALDAMEMALEELDQMQVSLRSVIKQFFPEKLGLVDGYGILNFGRSSNRYDKTLATLIESLQDKEDE